MLFERTSMVKRAVATIAGLLLVVALFVALAGHPSGQEATPPDSALATAASASTICVYNDGLYWLEFAVGLPTCTSLANPLCNRDILYTPKGATSQFTSRFGVKTTKCFNLRNLQSPTGGGLSAGIKLMPVILTQLGLTMKETRIQPENNAAVVYNPDVAREVCMTLTLCPTSSRSGSSLVLTHLQCRSPTSAHRSCWGIQ